MGKSSLMVRVADVLKSQGILPVIVDLVSLGSNPDSITADQWYFGVADIIGDKLGLALDLEEWWDAHDRLPFARRLLRFFRDVVLTHTTEPVVVFVDEIDCTLSLGFTRDFFDAVHGCHNARAEDHSFRRLTFVLLGSAHATDLSDVPARNPVNVGFLISLTDFVFEEALHLARCLGRDIPTREAVLRRVLHWTDGHPYLTQKVCQLCRDRRGRGRISEDLVDRVVEDVFFAPGSDLREDNLKFVRQRVEGNGDGAPRLLAIYQRILGGELVRDEPRSRDHSELKLIGLLKPQPDGRLAVRNQIYRRVFNNEWIWADGRGASVTGLFSGS